MSPLSLNNQDNLPLVEQIVNGIQHQINERMLRNGTRLPSIRQFASEHKVSRFTVVQAYDRLVANGYIQSRKGSGFYVNKRALSNKPAPSQCQLDRAVDVLWFLHQTLRDKHQTSLPGCGWLPSAWHDATTVQKSLRHLSRSSSAPLVDYGKAHGYLPLRQLMQQWLADMGVFVQENSIVTINGVSHGLDLIGRYLLRAGDSVLVDDPGYPTLFGYLKTLGVKLIAVPMRLDGSDIENVETLIQQHKPKVFFTNPILHNPTGVCINQARAYRLLQFAEKYNFWIVEDDIYAGFHPNPTTRLAALDQLQRVIYINSFSKTISADLRVGFIACQPELAHALVDLKLLTALSTSTLNEQVIYHVLADGSYRKYLERLRGRLQTAREHTLEQLEKAGLSLFAEPEHGMFVWAKFAHSNADAAVIASQAVQHGITLAPGTIFRPHQEPSPWLRFNVAFCQDERIFRFLQEAGKNL